jgi:D-alanine-D-alanine ligase
MRVGISYDLREDYLAQGYDEEQTAEFDAPETIAAIEAVLVSHGCSTTRIGNLPALAARLVAGERWDLVFNICEGLTGVGREAQVPALLEAYGVPHVFSDTLTMALALDKAMAKRVVRDCGVPTAPFVVVTCMEDIRQVSLPFPVFAKPLAEGTGKGISAESHIPSADALGKICQSLLSRHRQPVLVESYLSGREFTVGVVGSGPEARAVAVMEIGFLGPAESFGYSYANKEHYEDRISYRLAGDAEACRAAENALVAWRALNCRDGGRVDLRSDAHGMPNFLEVNPLAGLHPVRSDLVILSRFAGLGYEGLIGEILQSACKRHGLTLRGRLGVAV